METHEKSPALVYGHEPLQVTDRAGKVHTVEVRAVLNKELPAYIQSALDNEPALAELLTGKPPAFIDALTDESIYAINDLGGQINDPRVALWVERQARKAKDMRPLVDARLKMMREGLQL